MDSNDLRLTEAENKFWWIPVHMFKVEEESRPYHIKWLPPNNDNTTIETPEELYSITNVAGIVEKINTNNFSFNTYSFHLTMSVPKYEFWL